jgi:SecD/SecF fusion protein
MVERKLYTGLQKFLPEGTTYSQFDTRYKQGSQTVQPSISEELKNGAKTATIIAIAVICLYIFPPVPRLEIFT